MSQRPGTARGQIRQKRPFISTAQEATISILRTADAVRRRLAAAVEPHGITLQQYNVLRILRGASPQPLATLVIRERMIERMPGITRFLDALERRGLVRRERSAEDRRLVHCWITDAGRELLAGMDEVVDRADEDAVAALAVEEASTLIELLARVRQRLEA